MDAKNQLLDFLQTYPKATVMLEQLEKLFESSSVRYGEFAEAVAELTAEGLLAAVRAAGRNGRQPSLACRYRVNAAPLRRDHQQRLQQLRLTLYPAISLDAYFRLSEADFAADWPWIERVDRRLREHGLPTEPAPSAERSFELAGDEKWLDEGGGKTLLERVGLWDKLLVQPARDPLMMAVNPNALFRLKSAPSALPAQPAKSEESDAARDKPCLHLIVENKATFHALLPMLPDTRFHTLIYGCGNKIVGNMDMFHLQYPLPGSTHLFYYFGDIDHEGIRIWHEVAAQCGAVPALPFYERCLAKPPAFGKTNQRRHEGAVQSFLAYFREEERARLSACLQEGGYYPQEALSAHELRSIWRSGEWDARTP